MSTLRAGCLYHQLISLVRLPIFVRGRVDPRAIVQPEGGEVKDTFRKFRVKPRVIEWQVVFPNINKDIRMEIHCVNSTVQTREIIKCDCEFNICKNILALTIQ